MRGHYKWGYVYQYVVLFGIIFLAIMDYMNNKELNQMLTGAIISLGVGIPIHHTYSKSNESDNKPSQNKKNV